MSTVDVAVSVFLEVRPRLFGIAYRMLGSVTEAEDIVQEVWLRWQKTDRSVVVTPAAFLSSATTRLAINVLRSSRVRRETYIGPWLPEPIDTSTDPEVGAEQAEAVELALLILLEKLNPVERAAYVLREAFAYPYDQLAGILKLSPVNVRKIVSRARKQLSEEQHETVDASEHRQLMEAFVAAARHGDIASLEALLAPDAVSLSDGNGIRGAARVPVLGRPRVSLLAANPRFWRGAETRFVEANGRTGVMLLREGVASAFITCTASRAGIHQVLFVLSPSKIDAFLGSSRRSTGMIAGPGNPS